MRIISGRHKGKAIHPPKNFNARPTTDFAKEALFNVIANSFEFEDLAVLDLFAGTGSISYEFVSRGTPDITCVEYDFPSTQFIKKTLQELGAKKSKVIRYDVFKYLNACTETYDLIFADPPFSYKDMDRIPLIVFEKKILNPQGWLIVEHGPRTDLSAHPAYSEKREYGNLNFSIFKNTINLD